MAGGTYRVTSLETIEKLCAIIELQAEIINKQAEVIARSKVEDAIASELTRMRDLAEEKRRCL